MTDSIQSDESPNSGGEFDAASAFLKMWDSKDGESPSETQRKKRPEAREETPEPEADEDEKHPDNDENEGREDPADAEEAEDSQNDDHDDDRSEDEGDGKKAKVADDDAEIIFTVDGQEQRASVKDLKRLAGQEASLTRKSQEVAATKKAADTAHHTYATALQVMADKANEAFKPYANIDWLAASKQLDADEFSALRTEAQGKLEQVKFFAEELSKTMKERETHFRADLVKQAEAATGVLKDPQSPHHIPNWSRETFGKLREFAVGAGLAEDVIDTIVDPAALKLIHDAMQFRQAKKAAVQKVAKASPKRVVSSKEATPSPGSRAARASKAMSRLRDSGSVDDAQAAFMSRWGSEDE